MTNDEDLAAHFAADIEPDEDWPDWPDDGDDEGDHGEDAEGP